MVQYLQILLKGRMAKMEQRGATAVEYGLLVALIAAIIIAAVALLGTNIDAAFDKINDQIGGDKPPAEETGN